MWPFKKRKYTQEEIDNQERYVECLQEVLDKLLDGDRALLIIKYDEVYGKVTEEYEKLLHMKENRNGS